MGVWETADWGKAGGLLEPLTWLSTGFQCGSVAFSPDGKVLVAAGMWFLLPEQPKPATNRLAFWEVGSWRKLDLCPGAGAGATAWNAAGTATFSSDGSVLAIGYRDGMVRLWDLKRQRALAELKELTGLGEGFGASCKLSSDGRWLATFGYGSDRMVLYDLTDLGHPRSVATLRPHAGGCWSVAFAPDSRTLVTSGNDGLIQCLNLETLAVALTLHHSAGPEVVVAFSSDGELLASQDSFGLVKIWPAPSPINLQPSRLARQ